MSVSSRTNPHRFDSSRLVSVNDMGWPISVVDLSRLVSTVGPGHLVSSTWVDPRLSTCLTSINAQVRLVWAVDTSQFLSEPNPRPQLDLDDPCRFLAWASLCRPSTRANNLVSQTQSIVFREAKPILALILTHLRAKFGSGVFFLAPHENFGKLMKVDQGWP